MTAGVEIRGSNRLVQIHAHHRLLSAIRTVNLATEGDARFHRAYITDYVPTPYCRVAFRHTNGFFRPLWHNGPMQWYFWTPPPGTRISLYAETEVAGSVTAYIYDVPPPMPAVSPRPRFALWDQQGRLSYYSEYNYMNVVDTVTGVFPGAQQDYNSYGPGNYAVCPMQESQNFQWFNSYNSGGIIFDEYYDSVNWWRVNANGLSTKFVTQVTEVMGNPYGSFSRARFHALLHRV